jgi:hypothetical protein
MDRSRTAEGRSETLITRKAETPDLPLPGDNGQRLQVNVLYTTHSKTLAALRITSRLGAELGACPKVLLLYAVPYTLPLERPAVPAGFLEERIRALARESPTEITARIILCREPRRSLRQILRPHSVIVIGGRKGWWPSKEQRVAWRLSRDGHEVIFASLE